MRIEPATPQDCDAIAQVHVASWQRAYEGIFPADYLAGLSAAKRAESWRQVLAEGKSQLWVARDDGGPIGFVSFGPCRDKGAPANRGEIWAVYLAPEAWSKGIGMALCRKAQQELRAAGFDQTSLWVLSRNERAIRFYEGLGFRLEAGSAQTFEQGGVVLEELRYVKEQP